MMPVSPLTMWQVQFHMLHQQLKFLVCFKNTIEFSTKILCSTALTRQVKQYSRFIELSQHGQLKHHSNPYCFWKKYSSEFPVLALLAKPILSIPVSSASVERVFSQGGIIIRQHRSSMTSSTLSMLTFLKCNENFL